jgi:hypothetical protein
MKKTGFQVFLFLVLIVSCKQKKKDNPGSGQFLSVLSFIKSQVAQVDTSLNAVRKIIYVDSVKTDTIYYHREQFRELASDFLALPDISAAEYKERFKEETQFDETMKRVIISYQPVDPEKEEIQRQEVLVRPDPSGDKVTSIIIDYILDTKDSSVQKKLLWQVDRSFQVTTTRQLPGQPETITTFKVIWNKGTDE